MSAGIALPRQVSARLPAQPRREDVQSVAMSSIRWRSPMHSESTSALFLLREVTFARTASYSVEAVVNRVNADLANSFGNWRSEHVFYRKDCEGRLPSQGNESGLTARSRNGGRGAGREMPKRSRRGLVERGRSVAARGVRLQSNISTRRRRGRFARRTRAHGGGAGDALHGDPRPSRLRSRR